MKLALLFITKNWSNYHIFGGMRMKVSDLFCSVCKYDIHILDCFAGACFTSFHGA